MSVQSQRLFKVLSIAVFPLLLAQCGGGSGEGTPTSPSSTSGGGSQQGNTPGLSISPSSIQGQGQPQATVTLLTSAPAGGATVVLLSSNPPFVKVPANVTVPAGARTTSFTVDTSTVLAAVSVTITATYGGSSTAATLVVTPPAVVPAFVVRSPSRGLGACVMEPNDANFDCVLDGSGSTGFIESWAWTYTVGTSTLGHISHDSGSRPQIATKCAFLNTGTGGDGPNGDRFLNMEITLYVQDKAGNRSGVIRQAVKLYPNRRCNFTY